MTIDGKVTAILALVTAQSAAIANLTTAVSAIQGGAPADVTALQASIDGLTVIAKDVQDQLETDDSTPTPAPAAPTA